VYLKIVTFINVLNNNKVCSFKHGGLVDYAKDGKKQPTRASGLY